MRGKLQAFLLDHVRHGPVVFTDDRGLRFRLYPGENAGVYFAHGGNYEVAETRFVERILVPGDTAVDVGANIGLYALLFASLTTPTGRVLAIEPDPVNAGRLRDNLALNNAVGVEVVEAAAWSTPGRVTLNQFEPAFGPWHTLGAPELPHPFRPGETARPVSSAEVEAITLDEACATRGIARVDLLKLDVEGAELDALNGARRLLEQEAIDVLLFEVSLPQIQALGHEPHEIFDLLEAHRYSCHAIRDDGLPGDRVRVAGSRYGNYVAFAPRSPHAPTG